MRKAEKLSIHRKEMRRLDGYLYRFAHGEISMIDLTTALTTMPESVQKQFDKRFDTIMTRISNTDKNE